MPPKRGRGSDVQTARGRLQGALKDAVAGSEDEEDYDEALPSRGRPVKRSKFEPETLPIHQTFIMKLFDRSVDLAKYNENTALYPICRAWMINQPRSNKIINFKNKKSTKPQRRSDMPGLLTSIKNEANFDVVALPAAEEDVSITRLPSPVPFQMTSHKDNIDLNYDLDKPTISREDLLKNLKVNAKMVRQKWQRHTQDYHEAKYSASFRVLEAICKNI